MSCFIQSTLLVPILFLSLCFLAFIFCLEKPCFGAGISTLVLQLYKGYRTRVSIQGSIYLVSPLFYGLCQRVPWASLWSVLRFLEYFFNYGVFCLPFLPLRLHHVYNQRENDATYQIRAFSINFSANFPIFLPRYW